MPVNHTALASEFDTDPRGYGYAQHITTGNDGELSRIVNILRDGTNPPANPTAAGGQANGAILVNKGYLESSELANAIVYGEYTGGQATPRQYIDMLMTLPRISVEEGSNTRNALLTIFPAGTQTRTNLIAAAQRFASRAEELFGRGTTVSIDDVSRALRPTAQVAQGQQAEERG